MDQSGKTGWQIRIVGPDGIRVERVQREITVVGRSAQSDLIIANPEISRRHVTLKQSDGKLFILDEGSKNGTYLDGIRLSPQTPKPWRPGQILKLGLAPELLTLEVATKVMVGEEVPPPMESVVRNSTVRRLVKADTHRVEAPATNPEIKINEVTAKKVIEQKPADESDSQIQMRPVTQTETVAKTDQVTEPVSLQAKADAAKAAASALMADFERRMQEVLAPAQATIEKQRQQVNEVNVTSQAEKAKTENQLKDLREEVKARLEERKNLAKENAELKLALQNGRQELERLDAARNQLNGKLSAELSHLEKDIEDHKAQAQKDAREIIERAKKQSEMLLAEAEMKIKVQREKLQTEMADARKAMELDLADLKIKQMSEIKASEEELDEKFNQKKQARQAQFIQDVRQSCEKIVYASNLDSSAKLKLINEIEEALAAQFFADEPAEEVTAVRGTPLVILEESEMPTAPRFILKPQYMGAVGLIVLALGGWYIYQSRASKGNLVAPQRQIANVPVQAPPPAPVVAPPPPAPQAPVLQAPPVPQAPAVVQAPVPVASPPPSPPPAPVVTAPQANPWTQVFASDKFKIWQTSSAVYLRQSSNIERKRLARYQAVEAKYVQKLRTIQTRSPANQGEIDQWAQAFEKEGRANLGAAQWEKLVNFRQYFIKSRL